MAIGGWLFVVHQMKERIIETLGPNGSVEEIDVGLGHVTLSRVRLRGPKDWPASDAMRAERIVLDVDMHSLISRPIHLRSVSVENYYLSIVRSANGRVRILPGLKESARTAGGPPESRERAKYASEEKIIDRVSFERGSMEFFDSAVQNPPYRVLIGDARATVDRFHLPALTERTDLSMSGSIKGPSHTGAKAAVTGGTIDMTVDSTVKDYHIHAPGTLTLNHLQISDTGNPLDTFLSIPTKAAIAALKDRKELIKLDFVLDGDLRDPKFSLSESLSKKLAAGFAKALGVSAEGVAKGAGDTVWGIGNALKNLLGQ
ncbi:FIG00453626: hypothetical protein [Candidatus Paraburkholderia kirkii UZHbot1]|uniref:AsmA-like C-terminal domain-containing protein n=1 Tax=Candidatus Paraburkholderia kirkii UZHbot1 TaxID=1055526 RepID=G4MAV7_9BURK|nr:FIG00453626: hypothetical protein [Candidatus Paraburkholderia kirkii UZHbot1]